MFKIQDYSLAPLVGLIFLSIFFGGNSTAQAKLVIDVSNPNLTKMLIAVPDFIAIQPGQVSGSELAEIIRYDLSLTGLFHVIKAKPPESISTSDSVFEQWTGVGAQAVVLGKFHERNNQIVIEARLYDTALKRLELGKRFTAEIRDYRKVAHTFANRVMESLTGVMGCFTTQIAFAGLAKNKEIYTMDFDGQNLRQITKNGSINLSPEWSPDGRTLLFTSYVNGKPDLLSVDLSTMRSRVVSARNGLNASPRYSPLGDTIALSLNYKGIPKIFLLSTQGNILKRLTSGRGNDISPTWSPDRSRIAYVSDQAGSPQIYVAQLKGGQVQRITFESNYNTDPDWSPGGDRLAFTSRVEGRFQICTIRPDGTDYRVLTHEGSNQAPAWSPDGRMIAFSSNRKGIQKIYVMDSHGEIQVQVSSIPGRSAAWGRTPQ